MQLRTASSVAKFKVYAGADYVCVAVRMAGLRVLESAPCARCDSSRVEQLESSSFAWWKQSDCPDDLTLIEHVQLESTCYLEPVPEVHEQHDNLWMLR